MWVAVLYWPRSIAAVAPICGPWLHIGPHLPSGFRTPCVRRKRHRSWRTESALLTTVAKQVFVATSFALQPGTNASAGQAEGLALPEADPGSGSVDLVAGVGNLPFLQVRVCENVWRKAVGQR
jgi:hypothetical protein